jgi:glycerophosphoryl diester phosphodiesterase
VKKKTVVYAHRGASGYEIENSFSAFEKAIELGADGLETDCWLSGDKKTVILNHGQNLQIFPDSISQPIAKLSVEEIRKITLPNGEKIPTLQEFFERFHNKKAKSGEKLKFSIDLQDTQVYKTVISLLEEFELIDRVVLCGWNLLLLNRVRKFNSRVKLVASNLQNQIFEETLGVDGKIRKLKLYAFNIRAENFKPPMQDMLNLAKLKCFIWDLHTEEELRKYLKFRPDAVFSNFPDLAAKIASEMMQ